MYYFEMFRNILNPCSAKNEATLGNVTNSKPKSCVTQKHAKAKSSPPAISKPLKAGPTAM